MNASTCSLRPPRVLRQTPVDAFQQISQLRRRDRHRPIRALARNGRWPDKTAALEPLGEQAHALAVVPQHLDQATRRPRNTEQMAIVRIALERLLGPVGPGRRSPCAYRCGRSPTTPWTPLGIGIIAQSPPAHPPGPAHAPGATPSATRSTALRSTTSITKVRGRHMASSRKRAPPPLASSIQRRDPSRRQSTALRCAPAAATDEADWGEHRAAAQPRQPLLRPSGSPRRSAASPAEVNGAVAPHTLKTVAVITLVRCSQINGHTISRAETTHDARCSPDVR